MVDPVFFLSLVEIPKEHKNDKHVIVSADKAPNNIVLVCKSHYIDCLIKELGIDNSLGKPYIYPDDILDNHRSVLCSFGISTKDKKKTGSTITLLDS
jgi:hypothetical protein